MEGYDCLHVASARLHSACPLVSALRFALDEFRRALMAEAASVAVRAANGDAVYIAAAGPAAELVMGSRVPAGEGIVGRVLGTGSFDHTVDASRDARHSPTLDRLTQSTTRSMATTPIHPGGETIAVLQVLNPVGRGPFGADDQPLLAGCAEVIGSALVQRGDHLRCGVRTEAVPDLELRRQLGVWSGASETWLQSLLATRSAEGPTLLVGEPGSGREHAARALHAYRHPDPGPFVSVRATELADRPAGADLLAHGPLHDVSRKGGTVYLAHLEELTGDQTARLRDQLGRLESTPGLRTLAGSTTPPAAGLGGSFGGRVVEVPPLRSRPGDLPALAGEMVRCLRDHLGAPALGFEAEALSVLATDPLESNLATLRQRIAALLLGSSAPWIGADEVSELTATSLPGGLDARGIVRELQDSRAKVRSEALRRLEAAGATALSGLLTPLIRCLNEPQDWLRVRVIRLIATLGDRRSVRPLAAQLAHEEDPAIQQEILGALGRTRSAAALEPVMRHLRDANPDTRATVLLALGRLGGDEARRRVEELSDDPDPRVRCTAQGALFHIAGDGAAEDAETALAIQARIVILRDAAEIERRDLGDASVSLGRTPESDVTLPDSRVSKNHAVLEKQRDEWSIRDLGSTNGTFVNGRKTRQKVLVDGDEVRIGHYALRFEEEPVEIAEDHTAGLDFLEATLFHTVVPTRPDLRPGQTMLAPAGPTASAAVDRLIEEMRDDDPETRRWAARVLGELGQGVGPLIEILETDPDQEVRIEAVRALGQSRDPQAVQPLLRHLEDRLLRFAAIDALGHLRAPEALEPLIALVREERNSRVRRSAVRALGQIGHPQAAETLVAAIEVPTIRADALDALVRIGGDIAVRTLIAHLDRSDPLCADSIRGLGKLRAEDAVPPLIALLGGGDELLVSRCVRALKEIGAAATPLLIEALGTSTLRAAAVRALAVLADPVTAGPLLEHAADYRDARIALRHLAAGAVPTLLDGLATRPAEATRILASLPDVIDVAVLVQRLDDGAQAGWVERLLIAIGEHAVAATRAALREGDATRRVRAARILQGIGSPRALPDLVQAFDEPDDVGTQAVRAAAAVADAELPSVITDRWSQLTVRQRVAGVDILARQHLQGTTEPLAPALADEDTRVRCAAAVAASTLPTEAARAALEALIDADPSLEVRSLAASLAFQAGFIRVSEAAAHIRDGRRAPAVRAGLAAALTELDGAEGLEAAVELVRNGDEDVRSVVLDGLTRRGTEMFLHLMAQPDADALAGDAALDELWPGLAFRPELAMHTIAGLLHRPGRLSERLREHLAARRQEAMPYLRRELAAPTDRAHQSILLEALVAIQGDGDDRGRRT